MSRSLLLHEIVIFYMIDDSIGHLPSLLASLYQFIADYQRYQQLQSHVVDHNYV